MCNSRRSCSTTWTHLLAACFFFLCRAAWAADAAGKDLADLSLEELGNIEVTSVSKHAERLVDAAASVFVITSEDIRRSGATSLPEALRLAPNLAVARVSASAYAISARGFNNSIGNKLLVLIDGRTVYTPLFSGVNWDSQYVMLEDVERIEVISGPGGALWGANAVNGVINVITKEAAETQGTLVTAGLGDSEGGVSFRHGGALGGNGRYRVYGIGFERQNTKRASGTPLFDGLRNAQVGFRADWGGEREGFTLQGDYYDGRVEANPPQMVLLHGFNALGRWHARKEDGSRVQLQAYFDRTMRDDRSALRDVVNANMVDTFDLEFQHGFKAGESHNILWGGGYRHASDATRTYFPPGLIVFTQSLVPDQRRLNWYNLFIQDEIALAPAVTFSAGIKAETNIYTGLEYLPSARLAWKPSPNQLVWGALSRAVRAPARIDRDYRLSLVVQPPLPTSTTPIIAGGPDFQSEVANVIELGYRAQPSSVLSYSVTAHYTRYEKLRSGQPGTTPGGARIQNMMAGHTRGVEGWGNYQFTRNWRLSGGFTVFKSRIHIEPGSLEPNGPRDLGNDPGYTWMLRSTQNLTDRLELDVNVHFQRALPNPVVPSYTAFSARLGWHLNKDRELSLTLQNLFDPEHPEFGALPNRSEIPRAVFIKFRQSM